MIRAYFSGVESQAHFQQCADAGVRYMLMSYWQFYDRNPDLIKQRKQKCSDIKVFVDSGGHSFLDSDNIQNKFSKWKLQDFENYLEGYVRWLKKYRGYYAAAADFDIYATLNLVLGGSYASRISTSIIENWQFKYFMPLVEKGIPINFVWHAELESAGWERLCKEFPYVGLPGEMSKHSDFNKFISVAKRYTTRIHGFGAFKPADFKDSYYYSVDATTWKSTEMYGLLIHWTKSKKLIMEPDKLKWHQYKGEIDEAGFDGSLITSDQSYKEKTRYSIYCFQQMEKHYNTLAKGRMYYHELRLPHPSYLLGKVSNDRALKLWKKFRPAQLFKQHADEQNPAVIKEYLCAMAAVQYRVTNWFNIRKPALGFMQTYFPALFNPVPSDIGVVQKELSSLIAPPNPPAIRRTEPEHWQSFNLPKTREKDLSEGELTEDFDLELLPAF